MTQQRGLYIIGEAMKQPFGERAVTKVFSSLADASRMSREAGTLKMATGTGVLSAVGTVAAKAHNFHGRD